MAAMAVESTEAEMEVVSSEETAELVVADLVASGEGAGEEAAPVRARVEMAVGRWVAGMVAWTGQATVACAVGSWEGETEAEVMGAGAEGVLAAAIGEVVVEEATDTEMGARGVEVREIATEVGWMVVALTAAHKAVTLGAAVNAVVLVAATEVVGLVVEAMVVGAMAPVVWALEEEVEMVVPAEVAQVPCQAKKVETRVVAAMEQAEAWELALQAEVDVAEAVSMGMAKAVAA